METERFILRGLELTDGPRIEELAGDRGMNKIYAAFLTRNPASGKVMAKMGMTFEGVLCQHVIKWGQYEDVGYYSILRSEYEMA